MAKDKDEKEPKQRIHFNGKAWVPTPDGMMQKVTKQRVELVPIPKNQKPQDEEE